MASSSRPPLVDTLVGLMFYPAATVRNLQRTGTPHIAALFVLLALAIFAPMVWQVMRFDFLETRSDSLVGLFSVLIFTLVAFVPLVRVVAALFRQPLSTKDVLGLVAYGCAPLIWIVVGFYLVSLYLFGRLPIVTFLLTGVENANDETMMMFPIAQIVGKIMFLRIFYFGVRERTTLESGPALALTLLSAIPFYGALFLSLFLVELAVPRLGERIVSLVVSAFTLW